jgi:hypothetical protein
MNRAGIALGKRFALLSSASAGVLCLLCHPAQAFNVQYDNGVDIRLDNTIQYSILERTAPLNSFLANDPNNNDGDNNLRAGIVSNRVDLLTKLDISYHGYGFDVSADSFYDSVYTQNTQNTDNYTYNAYSVPASKFPSQTLATAGRNIELRNLFVYGSHDIGGIPVTLQVGRLVNIFGESLFFASNGIAYGTSPIDILRATSVPNTQAQDLFLPVGQALLTVQPTESISIKAYIKFESEKFIFMPVGSYFSTVDLLDEGAERIIAQAPTANSPGLYFYRGPDQRAPVNGQYGIAIHYDPPDADYDLGFYALQYNETAPQIYTFASGSAQFVSPTALSLGTYELIYPTRIQIYGVSGSTTLGPVNYAGEISIRTNDALESNVSLGPGETANNTNDTAYAKGDTLHYQASEVYLGGGNALWQGCSLLTEIAGMNLLAITSHKENYGYALPYGGYSRPHMALGLRTLFTANYFHVLPGLDVNIPIGLGWNFMGHAPDTPGFNNTGIDRGGDLTVGVSFTYHNVWTGGVSYTRYIAPPQRNPYADRDFVQANVERTF